MANTIPKDNYPFATQDGMAIPLDVIRPNRVHLVGLQVSDVTFTLSPEAQVAVFYSTTACVVSLGSDTKAIAVGNTIEDALYIPANTAVVSTVSGGTKRVGTFLTTGTLVVQEIERWAGLALDVNYTNR